jgi:hypothetical protein
MKYVIRAIKYFVAFCVLYLGIVWLGLKSSNGMEHSVWESVMMTMQTTRGLMLAAAVVVLSALYPRFGFMSRRVECDMVEDREQLLNAFSLSGFALKEESDARMVFRADNLARRIVMLFEDEIVVEQYAQWVEITGIRRGVANAAYRLYLYMDAKQKSEE